MASLDFAVPGSPPEMLRTPNKFVPIAAVAVNPEAAIWTPAAGKKFRFMGIYFAEGVLTGGILLKDGVGGTTIFRLPAIAVNTPTLLVIPGNGILSAAANNALTATGGGAGETLDGTIFGTEE